MKNGYRAGVIGLAALMVSGCVGNARIAVPASLAATSQRLELTGMGGGERGDFELASSHGRFTRSASQHTDEDGFFVRKEGGGTFEVAGPDFDGRLSGDCDFEEEELDSGVVVETSLRFAYRCTFRRTGQGVDGGLVLEEVPRSPGKRLSARTRAGEAHLNEKVIAIRAIHDMEGGRVPTGTPLGYMFDVDGRQVGAIDLNGFNKTIYAPASGPERETVLAASLALAILWDPME